MSRSHIVFQRDDQLLVTPGEGQAEVAASVRLCAQLEGIIAGSFRYRISPVALWGAAARGISVQTIIDSLNRYGSFPVPASLGATVAHWISRYGRLRIESGSDGAARLVSDDSSLLSMLGVQTEPVTSEARLARIRLDLARQGWPVVDCRNQELAAATSIAWLDWVELRDYQREAIDAFEISHNGVVLLPCGAGKTIVGVGAIVAVGGPTLVLTPSTAIGEQWRRTLLEMTTIPASEVVIWRRESQPGTVTIATYHAASAGLMRAVLESRKWALSIYDEVQSLPANTFRHVAAISAPKRLGLSATLVREDRREAEVFAMAGPIIFDVPWVELEGQGWIAPAECYEVRIPEASTAADRQRYKAAVVARLLASHPDEPTLVVGSNVASLENIARRFQLPLLTGSSDGATRELAFEAFRKGHISRLAVSRIGSVGLDLPSAKVMIQISGNFGSRQEEAQRLGRLLRPSEGRCAQFYSLVSLGTSEETYARKRQRFLVDQGYQYRILDAVELPRLPDDTD